MAAQPRHSVVTDHSAEREGPGVSRLPGQLPGGQVQAGEGEGDPGADLARVVVVVTEPLQVDAQSVG